MRFSRQGRYFRLNRNKNAIELQSAFVILPGGVSIMRNALAAVLLTVALAILSSATAQPANPVEGLARLSDLSIDMQWFLSYQAGESDGASFNQFALKRGYVNIKKKINGTFSGRITTDITTDREGDGEGDVEMRLKYLYLKTQLPSLGVFHKPYLEFGLVHRPWIDFEQAINIYRVQGTMFLERNDVINSGDFGVVLMSLFGGEMDRDYKKTVNGSFPGKYGSMAFGVFNGGG
ncbi:MAG: hypothetical protein KDM81_22040, partial [Verrucomicrobiae bacterium]|nr:hypothetical protein [Verrucomicrobiae bacterium]